MGPDQSCQEQKKEEENQLLNRGQGSECGQEVVLMDGKWVTKEEYYICFLWLLGGGYVWFDEVLSYFGYRYAVVLFLLGDFLLVCLIWVWCNVFSNFISSDLSTPNY